MPDNVFTLQDFLHGRREPVVPPVPMTPRMQQEYMPVQPPPVVTNPALAMLSALRSRVPSPEPAVQQQRQRQAPRPTQTPYRLDRQPRETSNVSLSLEELTDLVRRGESSGNYTALNRERPGNTASGAYQYTDRTWNNYGGYPKAMLAPPEVQDRRFAEDIQRRYQRYGGDIFKVIAEHYLPAIADDPARWRQPFKLRSGRSVRPTETYIRHILKQANNPELERAFDEYISQY